MPSIQPLPMFPKEYDPSDHVQHYQDILPTVARDESFVFHAPLGECSIEELMRVGVNRFTIGALHGQGPTEEAALLADGLGYYDATKTDVQFSLTDLGQGASQWVGPEGPSSNWPFIWNLRFWQTPPGATEPMSYEEGTERGEMFGTSGTVYVFENAEQDHAISSHWSFVKAWVIAWVTRLLAQWAGSGRKVLFAWNYFTNFGIGLGGSMPSQQKKDLFRSPLSSWPASPMLPGGNLELMNAYCIPMYWNSPELGYDTPYELAFQYYVKLKTGKSVIVFPAVTLENNPSGMIRWKVPEGDYYNKEKLPLEPNFVINGLLLARIWLDAFVPWGVYGKNTNDLSLNREYITNGWVQVGLWVPNGNQETELADPMGSPLLNPGTVMVSPSNGFMDWAGIANAMFNRTFKLTMGGTDEWLKYRIDGGAWYNPVNDWADDVINASDNHKPLVFSRWKDGIGSILINHPRPGDCKRHLIEFEFKGTPYNCYIAGNGSFVTNLTY
jgi:hypothetical protein